MPNTGAQQASSDIKMQSSLLPFHRMVYLPVEVWPLVFATYNLACSIFASSGCDCYDVFIGLDGVRLWTFPQGKHLPAPPVNLAARGVITCMTWVPFEKPDFDILLYGTTSGYLCVWRRDEQVRQSLLAWCTWSQVGQFGC